MSICLRIYDDGPGHKVCWADDRSLQRKCAGYSPTSDGSGWCGHQREDGDTFVCKHPEALKATAEEQP